MIRNFAFVAAVLLVAVLFIGLLYVVRNQTQPQTALASPTAAATATVTPVASTATPAPLPTPSPTPSGTYLNATFKFSVVLPEPYRKSARLSIPNTPGQRPAAQDAFTPRTEADEAAVSGTNCETACPIWNYVAVVVIYTDAGAQSPRQWYTSGGGSVRETIEDVTVDGRQAIKVTNGTPFPLQYIVKDGDRMFRLAYQLFPDTAVPTGATKVKLESILASFRFTP